MQVLGVRGKLLGFSTAICALARAGLPASVQAQTEEGERIVYQAPVECPDGAAFVAQVAARTRRLHLVPDGEKLRVLVDIDRGSERWSGRVSVFVAGSPSPVGVRQMQASTCSQLADALAFVVALAIDPDASPTSAAPPLAGAPLDAPGTMPPAAPATPLPAAPLPEPAPAPSPPSTHARPSPARAVPAGAAASRDTGEPSSSRSWFAGADFAVAGGTLPTTLWTVSPFVGWRAPPTWPFALSLRAGFVRSSATAAAAGASAQFIWTLGRVDGCTLVIPGVVRIHACSRMEGGTVDAAGESVEQPQSATRAWFAMGPVLRAEWTVVAGLSLAADLGTVIPFPRDRFFFGPDATVLDVPTTLPEADVGLAVLFL